MMDIFYEINVVCSISLDIWEYDDFVFLVLECVCCVEIDVGCDIFVVGSFKLFVKCF